MSPASVQAAKGITESMAYNVWYVLQIAGDSEVKAQIKLRINTATSQPVVIIRSFQVRLQLQHSSKVASESFNAYLAPWLLRCTSNSTLHAYILLCCLKSHQLGCTGEE